MSLSHIIKICGLAVFSVCVFNNNTASAIDILTEKYNPFDYLDSADSGTKPEEHKLSESDIEAFSRNLANKATYWNLAAEDIQRLRNQGLGYEELIKVVLIARHAGKPIEEIVKRRNRGEQFRKICKRYKVDYEIIRTAAVELQSEVRIYGEQ